LTDSEGITITVISGGEDFDSDLSRLKVYPNPYRGDNHSQITFDNLTANVQIKIYTLTGELVREVGEQEGDRAYWDPKNQNGERVSSGTYIYYIANPKGQEKRGKMEIIR
jgi:flagellar hook assembly protein FlgD